MASARPCSDADPSGMSFGLPIKDNESSHIYNVPTSVPTTPTETLVEPEVANERETRVELTVGCHRDPTSGRTLAAGHRSWRCTRHTRGLEL